MVSAGSKAIAIVTRMGTEVVRADLVTPGVKTLTTALSPLGSGAGAVARTIACVIAERKRLTILDHAIKREMSLRERALDVSAALFERDSIRQAETELERIKSGERVALARMHHEYRIVDALLAQNTESQIRLLRAEHERFATKLAFEQFLVYEMADSVESVFTLNNVWLRDYSFSQQSVSRALESSTRTAERASKSRDFIFAEMAHETTRTLSTTLRSMISERRAAHDSLLQTVQHQFRAIDSRRR